MPLDNILQSIEQNRSEEIRKIAERFQSQKEQMEKETERKIRDTEEYWKRRISEESRSLEKRELSNAEIEARRLIWEKRSSVVEERLKDAFDFLRDLRSTSSYRKIIQSMVETARKTLGEDCHIILRPNDAKLVKDASVEEKEIDPYGGIVAVSSDGTREMDLTITTLIKELREKLSLQLYEKIGED
ncbi:MAG: hypothetical protein KIY12_02345 [Thermoplasmata archaeon]|uniref:V-type proton ATPase subunit E n=1 Tax=Candidatus Sysuiplasma superficiale TaxID=2823368 RepID=A0A8J8CDE3_9ARCH|nr:hypothetical protein [Candidatus Sysuiplasma superficiale]